MGSETLSRRDFIKLGAAIAGAELLAACDNTQPQSSPIAPDLLRLSTEEGIYTQEIIQSAKRFMGLEVQPRGIRHERTDLEEALFNYLENKNASVSDILLALQAAGTIEGRGWGMQLLWQKRQTGLLSQFGVNPLDAQRIKWATDNEIDPRMLAIARDSVFPALELLKAAPNLFFEAIPPNSLLNLKIEDTLPNPAVVAKLNMTETGVENSNNPDPVNRYWGYVFIGGSSAWKELNLDHSWFPRGQEHLRIIAATLQNQTGLPYFDNVEILPGSEIGDPVYNGSGGAIGPQFMPINALLFMNWYNEANTRLGNKYPPANPFEPFTGTIMCYLYLAAEWYGRHGGIDDKLEIVRPGYRVHNSDSQKADALRKWNPTYQARIALDSGYKYYRQFGRV